MNKNYLVVMNVIGLLALLISLPLEWMTITNINMQTNSPMLNQMGEMMNSMMQSMAGSVSIPITGMDGSVTMGVTLPFWLLVVLGAIGIGLGLLTSLQVVSVPKTAVLIPLIFSAIFVIVALCSAVYSSDATVGVGVFAALSGLALGAIATVSSKAEVV